jgi:hypothetical protein
LWPAAHRWQHHLIFSDRLEGGAGVGLLGSMYFRADACADIAGGGFAWCVSMRYRCGGSPRHRVRVRLAAFPILHPSPRVLYLRLQVFFSRDGAPLVCGAGGCTQAAALGRQRQCETLKMRAADEGSGSRASAVPADAVAALVRLYNAATEVERLGRTSRAIELYESTLAAAEKALLPRDSLIVADVLGNIVTQLLTRVSYERATDDATWLGDGERLFTLASKTLALCEARFRAGTLFTPTADEHTFFDAVGLTKQPARFRGARAYAICAAQVLPNWPTPDTDQESEEMLRVVGCALRAMLEMKRRGLLDWRELDAGQLQQLRTSQASRQQDAAFAIFLRPYVHKLLQYAMNTRDGGAWEGLRTTCAFTALEETALRQLASSSGSDPHCVLGQQMIHTVVAARHRRAAEDIARHGLRACTLPECQQTEPYPKTFKVCSRCRAACYCSAAHQQQDWRRHKREDGCSAAAAAAGP